MPAKVFISTNKLCARRSIGCLSYGDGVVSQDGNMRGEGRNKSRQQRSTTRRGISVSCNWMQHSLPETFTREQVRKCRLLHQLACVLVILHKTSF